MNERTLKDMPEDLLPYVLGYKPTLKIIDLSEFIQEYHIYYFNIKFIIQYSNHFIAQHIMITCSSDYEYSLKLISRIDDFINNYLKKNIPCELNLYYTECEQISVDHIKEEEKEDNNFICAFSGNLSNNDDAIIKYTGKNYMIGDMILSLDSRDVIFELLYYIKSILYCQNTSNDKEIIEFDNMGW